MKLLLVKLWPQGGVAPRVGAWIETMSARPGACSSGRPPRGGVD